VKNSVALLIAARTELAVHDDREVVVSNLCQGFGEPKTKRSPRSLPRNCSRASPSWQI